MSVTLYLGGEGSEAIPWPDDPAGRFAKHYLTPILANGTRWVAPNVDAELGVALVGEHVVPFTWSKGDAALERRAADDNSYVVSPRNHFITYGAEEIGKLDAPVLVPLLRAVVAGLGWGLGRAGFDDVVYVNNWLLSTSLYPAWRPQDGVHLLRALVERFQGRAIVFRSLDVRTQRPLAEALVCAGAHLVFSRRVLFQEPRAPGVTRRSDYRKDAKLLRAALDRDDYRVVPTHALTEAQLCRAHALYGRLYVEKWSRHNPRFELAYLRHVLLQRLLEGQALVTPEGRLDAMYASWTRGRITYAPILGYDTHLPQRLGLYRMISALSSLDAAERDWLIHDSAGVSDFKQNRGALPSLEHLAIYDAHLPRHRRPFRALGQLMNHVAVPIIERYDL